MRAIRLRLCILSAVVVRFDARTNRENIAVSELVEPLLLHDLKIDPLSGCSFFFFGEKVRDNYLKDIPAFQWFAASSS